MQIEAFAKQLGYDTNDHIIEQFNKIVQKNSNITQLFDHILDIHTKLKHINGFVAISNSVDCLKIKCENSSPELLEEFHMIVSKFATKYKLNIKKVPNKEVYYIL